MQKLTELDNWNTMSFPCNRKRIFLHWISLWLRFRNCKTRWNPWMMQKNFVILKTANSSGLSHVPSQPSSIPSQRRTISCDSRLQPDTRNSMDTSGYVFEGLLVRDAFTTCREFTDFGIVFLRIEANWYTQNRGTKRRSERRTAAFNNTANSSLCQDFATWNSSNCTGGTCSQSCMMENPRNQISELHFGKCPDSRSLFRLFCNRNVVDQRRRGGQISGRSFGVLVKWRAWLHWFSDAWCEDCVCVEKNHLEKERVRKNTPWIPRTGSRVCSLILRCLMRW